MTAPTLHNAWEMVKEITGKGYMIDEAGTITAGHKMYREADEDVSSRYWTFVCEFDDRLELNLADGRLITIWIEPKKEQKLDMTIATDCDGKIVFKNANFKVAGADCNNLFAFINIMDDYGMIYNCKTSDIKHFDLSKIRVERF